MTASRLVGALLGLVLLCAGVQSAAAQTVGADAAIDKVGGGTKTVGQSVSFTVTARNAGSLPLPGTLYTVTDTIVPPLTGPVTASGSNWTCTVTGTQVSCHYTGGAVLPGASLPPITITAMAGSPGSYNNCARVALGAIPDANPRNNEDCAGGVIQSPVSQYDVGVEKAVRGPSVVGQTTTFTLSPFNVGPSPVGSANAVQIVDVLPANFTAPITASGPNWTCSVSGQMVTCTYVGPSVGVGGNLPVITITAMTKAPGPWRNCARIGLRGDDVNKRNNEDCITGEARGGGDGRFDIGIRKTGPAVTVSGQPATFTLSPFNGGPSPANGSSGVRVTDQLPANFVGPVTAMGSGWTCTISGSGPYLVTCDWFGGPIPANGLFPPITIKATAKEVGGWTNCAEIDLKAGRDGREENDRSCIGGEIRPGKPDGRYDVGVRKRGPDVYTAGQPATFTLATINNGPAAVDGSSGVYVTDTLMAGLNAPIIINAPSGWTCSVSYPTVTCHYTGGPVAPGQGMGLIKITATVAKSGEIKNCAEIGFERLRDIQPEDNRDCVDGPINGKGGDRGYDVSIRKRGPGPATAGQPVTFTLTPHNNGPSAVTNGSGLIVTDTLMAGLTAPVTVNVSTQDWNCVVSGPTVTCAYVGPPVPAGQDFPQISITPTATKGGEYKNCAAIEVKAGKDTQPGDNSDCVGDVITTKPAGYDIGIEKTGPEKVTVGQSATFNLNSFNTGPSTVTNGMGVTVTDTLPANFAPPLTIIAPGWSCTASGLSLICQYIGPPVTIGQPFPPIKVSAVAIRAGQTENCASIRLKPIDIKPSDNGDCVGVVIIEKDKGNPDLAVEKTALEGPWAWPNAHGHYQITVTNVGNVTLPAGHALTLLESIPAGMTLAAVPAGWTCTPGAGAQGPVQVSCSSVLTAPLPPGASISMILEVKFWGERRKTYENCVDLRAFRGKAPWEEVRYDNNHDCATVEVIEQARYDVDITKTGPAHVVLGQGVSFTLSPSNNGPSPVSASTGLVVTDTVPPNFSGPMTASGNGWSCVVNAPLVTCSYTGTGIFTAGQSPPPITITAVATGLGQVDNCTLISLKPTDLHPDDNDSCINIQVDPRIEPDVRVCIQKFEDINGDGIRQGTEPRLGGWSFEVYAANDPNQTVLTTMVTRTTEPYFGQVCTNLKPGLYVIREILQPGWISTTPGGNPPQQQVTVVAGDYPQVWFGNKKVAPPSPPDLSATKVFSGYSPTGEMNFSLTATNQGPGDWSGPITFTDQLPAGLTPVSYAGSGWVCTISGQTYTCSWNGPPVHVGDSFPALDLHVMPTGPGSFHNCATVKADVTGWQDPTPANNRACADATYQPSSLTLTKSILDDCYQNGNGNDIRCTFRITITNPSNTSWTGPIAFTDTVLPQNASFTTLIGGSPAGWTCMGNQPMICTSNGSVTVPAGGSVTVDYTVDIASPIAQHSNCASLYAPNATDPSCVTLGGGAPPSLTIEKVVEQDCSGVAPNTLCKFVIRIFNTGSTPFIGQLTFTDLVSLSGMPISGVSYANPHPGGWACTGIQPLTCLSGIVSIAPGAFVTVPLYMNINGPVPANQNCATLTLPVTDGPSCVPMGSTHVDLGLDSNFMADPAAPGFHELSYWITTTPQLLPGMQVTVTGSLTPAGYFLPAGPIPPSAVTSAGWACSGGWASFLCSQTVTNGSFTNGFLVLRLRTSYPANAVGQNFTYVGAVTTNNNLDPDTTNNARTITAVLN